MEKTNNLQEFQKKARDFALDLTPLPNRATVVGLYGDLGSGKTTFVQSVAKALGISHVITSPTFLIFKRFKIPAFAQALRTGRQDSRFKNLIHVDAYRLKNGEELRRLRFEELLRDPTNLIFIEWADRVADILPENHQKLYFEFVDEQKRKISQS